MKVSMLGAGRVAQTIEIKLVQAGNIGPRDVQYENRTVKAGWSRK